MHMYCPMLVAACILIVAKAKWTICQQFEWVQEPCVELYRPSVSSCCLALVVVKIKENNLTVDDILYRLCSYNFCQFCCVSCLDQKSLTTAIPQKLWMKCWMLSRFFRLLLVQY